MQFIYYNVYSQAPAFDAVTVRRRASESAFGGRLITNNFRALVVEAIVACVVEPEWHWCSADYSAWDFEQEDGIRLEVKQSASQQTWHSDADKPSKCSFDIRARKGRYEGAAYFSDPGRNADIYVLAHHGICGKDADQADPAQWRFYVIPAGDLPAAATISLSKVRQLSPELRVDELKLAINDAAVRIPPRND